MASFSGAVLKDRALALPVPLVALFGGDVFIGFHKLIPVVYASFLLNVLIGRFFANRRTVLRIGAATLLGSAQFFLATNFADWGLLNSYVKTASGLAGCYLTGLPFFWNTLAGDSCYAAPPFGGITSAEQLFSAL